MVLIENQQQNLKLALEWLAEMILQVAARKAQGMQIVLTDCCSNYLLDCHETLTGALIWWHVGMGATNTDAKNDAQSHLQPFQNKGSGYWDDIPAPVA